jgi:hypothetical protein
LSKKTIAFLFILIILPIILYLFWPSDEKRIKKLFKEGSHAIEKEDLDSVMSKVSYNYHDEYGLTYLFIKENIKSSFQRMNDIRVEYEDVAIEVNDGKATAEMDVRIIATIGSETGYILGDLPNPAHLIFNLEKERTKWLIIKTQGLPVYW